MWTSLTSSHLDQDERGRPVPYINAWGKRGVRGRTTCGHDPNADGKLSLFLADAKDEGPDFKQQNPQRQRECFALGLCQVCARTVELRDRYLIIAPRSVKYVDVGGVERLVIDEPWIDKQCAEFAMTYCPGLLRQGPDVRIEKAPPPGSYTTIFETRTGPETREQPIVFYIKITIGGV